MSHDLLRAIPRPWRIDPGAPDTVLDANGNRILTAALWPGAHATTEGLNVSWHTAKAVARFAQGAPGLASAAGVMIAELDRLRGRIPADLLAALHEPIDELRDAIRYCCSASPEAMVEARGAPPRTEAEPPPTERIRIEDVTAVKEAYRYYIDASDAELAEIGITRADALDRARTLDEALGPASDLAPPSYHNANSHRLIWWLIRHLGGRFTLTPAMMREMPGPIETFNDNRTTSVQITALPADPLA